MDKIDLSVLIPARNEEWLDRTIQDLLENIEGNTEIIAVLDGYIPDPPLTQSDKRVTIIYLPKNVGQRAATNIAAKVAKGKYLMKCDAHVAVSKGFDVALIKGFEVEGDDVVFIPVMRNLHVFNWVCDANPEHFRYQGKSGKCNECGGSEHKEVVWIAKNSPQSTAFRFDKTLHFQYWREWGALQKGEYTETMSIQGSCFCMTKESYFALDICSETDFHSWGQQGVEVACKRWMSGGRVLVNRNCWYAHLFRTQGGDFSFPYSNPQSKVDENRVKSRELFQGNKWPLAVRPFEWIIDHFNPPDWGMTKGIIYYSDNEADISITKPVIDQLTQISQEDHIPIVTACLKKKADFGIKNIYFPSLKRGILAQCKQILSALEHSSSDIIYFCEADILYHPTHFDFTPPEIEKYYYNVNVWKVRWSDGHSVKVDDLKQLSGLVGHRDFLINHFKKKIEIIEQRQKDLIAADEPLINDGASKYMGYEPGMHSEPRGVDNFPVESFSSQFPNVDIRHDNNLTKNRWNKEEFKNQEQTIGWTETTSDKIPGWEEYFAKTTIKTYKKGIIFYTDSQLDKKIAEPVRNQLLAAAGEIPIVSASLKKMNFGRKNIFFPSLKRGYCAMFKQILAALENSDADIIYFTEHDVLYSKTHFDFIPEDQNTFYYNRNVWFLRTTDGHALHYDVDQLSGLCVFRQAAITHFKERLELAQQMERELTTDEFNSWIRLMGFEPMTHNRIEWKSKFNVAHFFSEHPNIDIKHGANLTGQRWRKDQYRNQQLLINWIETDDIIAPWGSTKGIAQRFN